MMQNRKSVIPKGVWFATKRLSGGETIRYGYYGRGPGNISLGREGTAEFHEALGQVMRREPATNTMLNLIWRYRRSGEFLGLGVRTQADYRKKLDLIQATFGKLSLRAMSSMEIAKYIYNWRDSMATSPRQADYGVAVLKVVLGWGASRGYIEHNRALNISQLYTANRSGKIWRAEDEATLMAVASRPLRAAMILALETGQSQADLITMPWSAVNGDLIIWRRAKTKAPVVIPISPLLRASLGAPPADLETRILTTAEGKPWAATGNGLRAAWREACKRARIEGLTFNDLRGTFITRRRELGWSEEEVALCSGHPMTKRGAFHAYVDRKSVAIASARRLAKQEGWAQ